MDTSQAGSATTSSSAVFPTQSSGMDRWYGTTDDGPNHSQVKSEGTDVRYRWMGLIHLLAGLTLAVTVVIGACSAPSSPSSARGLSQQPSTSVRPSSPSDPLSGLASLAVQRIMTADQVAAAKFGTHQPIDDPPREQQVLDSVAAASPGMGISPQESAQFFRDQIEANKVVQRGLYQRWTAYPKQRPTDRPDLNEQVRPDLDRLTTDILRQLQATTTVRHAGMQCIAQARQALAEEARPLDQLHRDALTVALRSVCSQS